MLLQQVINGLTLGSMYALLAVGFALICGILKMITFAHGEVFMVGAFAGLTAIAAFHLGPLEGLLAAMAVSLVLGLLTERIAFRPFREGSALSPALITIGFSIILQAGVLLLAGADTKAFPYDIGIYSFNLGGTVISGIEIIVIGLTLLLMVALQLFIHKTRWGLALRATSMHFDGAGLMGVNTNHVVALSFALASALAGIAGLLVGAYYGAFYPRMGVIISLKALAAATLGGIGSVSGAMLGSLLLGLIESLTVAYISAGYRDVIAFAVLIAVLLIRPSGLLGRVEEEKV
ncbi:putative membrane protein [Propionispora sp. 2/2-37]|uniref:branched-chain amino acid ABC transporter permease n=1 Tax=Propionispora sp. 2/2-37 TaxID=1677858 RepID=UPI0006BB5F8D|nr:branched-chain amino acid ABC transporter permease [Propionispora sp. 2/2-37]CUH95969.1 putative membrane protein [Propionispora sp. 2/2-37]